MPVKRYAKIGRVDGDYCVYRRSAIDGKIIIISDGFATQDKAETFLDDFDPLFLDCDQDERFMVKI